MIILTRKSNLNLHEDIVIHDTLNPNLWDKNNNLIPTIRIKLLEIVNEFQKQLLEDNVKLKIADIYLLGSNANYNYNSDSDIDVHIIADESTDCNQKHLSLIYNSLKTLFNQKYDFIINGYNVELYVENKDAITSKSGGVYSLLTNKWIQRPSKYEIPEEDKQLLTDALNKLIEKYRQLISNEPTVEAIDSFVDYIYNLRTKGLQEKGEFSIGNLLFKEFRKLGYLDNLKQLKTKLINLKLSL